MFAFRKSSVIFIRSSICQPPITMPTIGEVIDNILRTKKELDFVVIMWYPAKGLSHCGVVENPCFHMLRLGFVSQSCAYYGNPAMNSIKNTQESEQ